MDLQVLIDETLDHIEAWVTSVSLDDGGNLRLQIEYDDVVMPRGLKRAELKCIQATDFNVTPGWVAEIAHFEDHPLLWSHQGPQAQLYFSSAPHSPAEVFYLVHRVVMTELGGWRNPADYLNGTPEELWNHLAGGYGASRQWPLGPDGIAGFGH
ncbi:hypothetical protein J2X16_004456 [Pelomonas aquatica]|uniref:Uncharacterized protein n=1 Tax=Pelomonas aquatica TaxID=431058 RepID=A0ABU1ZEP4_9BURK|nr:hypothetical protein [Pelomonas aquatica]MDR7299088.1 hypothetical protein [Pelomonas aquatica]